MIDLTNLTSTFGFLSNGFKQVLIMMVTLVITLIVAEIIRKVLGVAIKKRSKLMRIDHTQYKFLKHFLTAAVYIVGIGVAIYNIPSLKTLSLSIFAGAGIIAVIIGFASQQAFANIVSGIFVVIFKPFNVDDRIKIGTDVSGVVEDITLRHTVIRTFENKRIIIPNSIISSEKIENANHVDEKICKFVDFGISYDSDVDKAMKIMQQEAIKHPDFLDNRTKEDKKDKVPPVQVKLLGFGDSSVNLRAWVWVKDPSVAFRLGCDLNKSIKKRFDKEGIEIPFPYRTIVQKTNKTPSKKKIKRKNKVDD